jgi:hypothetical protein
LYLNGLTSLSDKAVEALARHKGHLYLNCLTSLNDSPGHIALAEKLAKEEYELSLKGLTSLSEKAAEALAKYDGHLDLDGLTNIRDKAAEAIAKHSVVLEKGMQ